MKHLSSPLGPPSGQTGNRGGERGPGWAVHRGTGWTVDLRGQVSSTPSHLGIERARKGPLLRLIWAVVPLWGPS